MIKYLSIFIILFSSFTFSQESSAFLERVDYGQIANDEIDEASGLAASIKNKGILWTHNDSGGENRIFAIDTNGNNIGEFYLNGVSHRDWEDIVVGYGPDDEESYIYIGDIGDNESANGVKYIYRIIEPSISDGSLGLSEAITDFSVITFTYPDGPRDAETLMIDPLSKDLYILGKRDSNVRLYRLPYPHYSTPFQAELVDKITFPFDPEENTPQNYITAGDISLDGTEIIIKTYSSVYYWYRSESKTIKETLNEQPSQLPYTTEVQGEAICWRNDNNNGYFTLSEENIVLNSIPVTIPAHLYYYPRKVNVTDIESSEVNNKFSLMQNYPNPFNPITNISYTIPENFSGNVKITIYNLLGNQVATLVNESKSSGNYTVMWDAGKYSSGIYYYQIKTNNYVNTKKMVFLK